MASASEIQVPILDEELILSVIKDITNEQFTANDLKTPTYNKLYPVYSGFICHLLNVSNEQISQVPLHVMETVAHPELCIEEATGHLLFIKALEYLFNACCINNFSMSDLIAPTKKRTRRLLSAIVNFAQFHLQYESVKTEVSNKLETLIKDQEVYAKRRDHLKEKIALLKAQKIEKQKAVQEMNLSALKAKQQETDTLKEQTQRSNLAVKSEVEELQNVLTVAKASKLIRQGKEAVEEHLNRGHTLAVKEKIYNGFGEVAPSTLKLITNINEDTNACMVATSEVEKIRDRTVEQSIKLKNLSADKQNLQRLIQSHTEKRDRFASKYNKKMVICNETQKELNEKEAKVLSDVKEKNEKLNQIRMEMKNLTEQELLEQKDHKNIMKMMKDKQITLQKKIAVYHDSITTECGEVSYKMDQLTVCDTATVS